MSTWRKKAIECLPSYKKDLESPETSIYTAFHLMLPALKDAHIANDTVQVENIYGFAAWCFRQKAEDLWNAAGVSFYEHLADDAIVFEQLPRWLGKDIYIEIRGLLERRITADQLNQLDRTFLGKTR